MIIDKAITLSSAIIRNKEGAFLLLQRSSKASFPMRWQLVEGKLEENELPINALKREVLEEIGEIVTKAQFITVVHNTLEANNIRYLVIRALFSVKSEQAKIKLSDEHIDFDWLSKEEISERDLLPGTKEAIEKTLESPYYLNNPK